VTDDIVFSHRRFILFVALSAIAGCNSGLEQQAGAAAGQAQKESAQLLSRFKEDERYALRVRTDTARGRVWMLSISDHVRVYDERSKRLLRQIRLPGWLVVKTPCMPDLILDRSGSAYISSNVSPWIWQIDAAGFQVRVHEVRMPGREGLDFGFGTLAFTAKGTLYGLAPSASSVWNIDVAGANANMIETYLPPLEACELTAQTLDRIETMNLSTRKRP